MQIFDKRDQYGISICFDASGGFWQITQLNQGIEGPVVFSFPYRPEHEELEEPPEEVRHEYERLIEYDPNASSKIAVNAVEVISDGTKCAFDQPCRYGYRVESHAVYCHNLRWLYSPRKCRRTWYTGGDIRDEDCPGFEARLPIVKG